MNDATNKIRFTVGVNMRGPIAPGSYLVPPATVEVSYPTHIDATSDSVPLAEWLTTQFVVSWDDDGRVSRALSKGDFTQHLLIYDALRFINVLVQAFKLVRIDHIDGSGLRTLGLHDSLYFFLNVGDGPRLLENRLMKGQFSKGVPKHDPTYVDFFGTTDLAKPHIAKNDFPVARRFLRCYELLEHGFYSEAFVMAFSIVDALVQDMLDELLIASGMTDKEDRKDLVRGIKENRLMIFLGPLLKLAAGKPIAELWPQAPAAVKWINKHRNSIMHGGSQADISTAAQAIYACIQLLVTLDRAGFLKAEFPVGFFRHAKITAAWTHDPPDWVPSGAVAEAMDFSY